MSNRNIFTTGQNISLDTIKEMFPNTYRLNELYMNYMVKCYNKSIGHKKYYDVTIPGKGTLHEDSVICILEMIDFLECMNVAYISIGINYGRYILTDIRDTNKNTITLEICQNLGRLTYDWGMRVTSWDSVMWYLHLKYGLEYYEIYTLRNIYKML